MPTLDVSRAQALTERWTRPAVWSLTVTALGYWFFSVVPLLVALSGVHSLTLWVVAWSIALACEVVGTAIGMVVDSRAPLDMPRSTRSLSIASIIVGWFSFFGMATVFFVAYAFAQVMGNFE